MDSKVNDEGQSNLINRKALNDLAFNAIFYGKQIITFHGILWTKRTKVKISKAFENTRSSCLDQNVLIIAIAVSQLDYGICLRSEDQMILSP